MRSITQFFRRCGVFNYNRKQVPTAEFGDSVGGVFAREAAGVWSRRGMKQAAFVADFTHFFGVGVGIPARCSAHFAAAEAEAARALQVVCS